MAVVHPFKAIRPNKDIASTMISNSFENYSSTELTHILATKPNSFLQIITAGSAPGSKKLSTKKRFGRIKKTYQEFRKQNSYIQEERPCYYLYQIKNQQGTFTGIIAKTSTEEYQNRTIKKHEEIISSRKKNFANYLKHVGFNADPVLLTYPDNKTIDGLIQELLIEVPTYDFSTSNEEHHKLWIIDNEQTTEKLEQTFDEIPELYIADGHHRCASSSTLSKMLQKEANDTTNDNSHKYFMSYLLPESQLKIHEFNRLITDLNGHSKEQLLAAISEYYHIENYENSDQISLHDSTQFSMYLDGKYYRLVLKKEAYQFTNVLSKLAPQLLNQTILQPILGITDARKDPRIHCFYAKEALQEIKNYIDYGTYKIGFSMKAVSVNELKAIADATLKMPPKSTYVLPKLPSGFLLYEF